jgi:hypothetical protein
VLAVTNGDWIKKKNGIPMRLIGYLAVYWSPLVHRSQLDAHRHDVALQLNIIIEVSAFEQWWNGVSGYCGAS